MTRELTPAEENFTQLLAAGKTQSDAYREAFPKTVNWKDETIWSKASTLSASGKVKERLKQLQERLEEKALWSREQSVQTLLTVINDPDKKTDIIAAVKELNAMHGFNAPQVIDHKSTDGTMTPAAPVVIDKSLVKSVIDKLNEDI